MVIKTLNLANEQKGIYFDCLKGSSVEYNNVITVSLKNFDQEAFVKAIEFITAEQELLRASFTEKDGEPLMVIYDSANVSVTDIDMSSRSDEEINQEINRFAGEEIRLGKTSLFSVRVIRSKDEWFVVFKLHHLVSDGTSMSILLKKVFTNYNAFCSGLIPDSKVDNGYSEFVNSQEKKNSLPRLEKKRNNWIQHLESADPVSLITKKKTSSKKYSKEKISFEYFII